MRLSFTNTNEFAKKRFGAKSLNKTHNEVSFKGMPQSAMKVVMNAFDNSSVLTSRSDKINVHSTLNSIRKKIGHSADVLYRHVIKDDIINKGVIREGSTIQFKNKRPLRLIFDGLVYPIAKIPFYILYGGINKLKKINAFKNSTWLKNFEKSSFYKATHSYLKKDDKLNALQGLMELGNMSNPMGSKMRAKTLLQSTAKTFDSKFGNYNGVNERALTRIVTGFIPAFFLANDAHNLSILCTNNKKEAQTEKKLRFNQESRRVLSNAYIQLITLGALSKFINKSKGWFVGVTVGTVLLTEIYSRLRTGKKIHFISPAEAKEMNNKEEFENTQKNLKKGLSFVLDKAPTPHKVSINGINDFIANPKYNKFEEISHPTTKPNKTTKTTEKPKSLITASTLLKAVVGIIVAGFAIKGLKKLPLGKGNVGDIFNNISKGYKKIYTKLTMKPNHLEKTDMTKVFAKMRNCGFGTIADSYEKVVMDYQKLLTYPKHIGKEFIEAVKKTGDTHLAKHIEAFATGKNQKQMLASLKEDIINHNFKVFVGYLKKSGKNDLVNSINEINKEGKINYPKLRKLFGKSGNEQYKEIFENIFAVDDNSIKQNLLLKAKKSLNKAGFSEVWNSTENKVMNDINSSSFCDLGKKKIPIVKDVVDFCIEPFKFMWGFVTMPYKGIQKIAGAFKANMPTAQNDIDAVAKALGSLTKKTEMSNKAFTDMFNEKIVKGFNSTTMSKVANSELSALAKTASTAATMTFLISDNYNMVMLKSNGENKDEASLKAKERFVQEMSRFFWQQLFINLFNNTFSHTYNASLLGASAVNTASTTIGEICTRKAVGLPITASSKEEIIELEKKNLSGDGLKSKFFRFMSKLTGKQILSERETKNKK